MVKWVGELRDMMLFKANPEAYVLQKENQKLQADKTKLEKDLRNLTVDSMKMSLDNAKLIAGLKEIKYHAENDWDGQARHIEKLAAELLKEVGDE